MAALAVSETHMSSATCCRLACIVTVDLRATGGRVSHGAWGGLDIPCPFEAKEAAPLVRQLCPPLQQARGLNALQSVSSGSTASFL